MISIPSKLSLLSSVWQTCTHPNNGKLLHDMVFSYFFGHRQVLIRRLTDHLVINIPFHFHIMVKPSKQASQLLAEWHTCMKLQYYQIVIQYGTCLPLFGPDGYHCKKLWVVSTSLYGRLSCTHVCRSNAEISLRNLLNKLYIISLL